MEETKNLSVHIVAWNSFAFLPSLFASLHAQDTNGFSVTVVDNASNDGTVKWITDSLPHVGVLRNFRNQGFARAHNQAITLALSHWPEDSWPHRYILVANPDMEFAPDCLRRLVEVMERDPSVSACGPKLLRAIVRSQEEGQMESERTNVIDSTGMVIKRSRRAFDRGAGEEDKGQYDTEIDVFGISGACVLFRASALAGAKLAGEYFDEDFFAYKEDVDLAWRMRRLGMKTVYVPEAVAWHHRRAPSAAAKGWAALSAWKLRRRKSPFVNYLSTRNHHWLLWKNDEWGNMALHAVWLLPYEFAKCLSSLVSWTVLKGNFAALSGVRKMWRKRRELNARASVSGAQMRAWFV